ncbi:MAG: hypothetical protein ABS939_00180 [Psychrobacillus sp.]
MKKQKSKKNLTPKGNGEKFRNISMGVSAIARAIIAFVSFLCK